MEDVLPLPGSISLNIDEIRRGSPSPEDFVTDLYVKFRPPLIAYVYHLLGSTRDAEDIVQVAFIQLFDQVNRNVEIRNVRGWLYRVVHNLAIDFVRRSGRRETLFEDWFADHDARSSAESVEQELIDREQIEISLSRLNERERHCLMLRAEGLSYQEIADVLDTTAKSVTLIEKRG